MPKPPLATLAALLAILAAGTYGCGRSVDRGDTRVVKTAPVPTRTTTPCVTVDKTLLFEPERPVRLPPAPEPPARMPQIPPIDIGLAPVATDNAPSPAPADLATMPADDAPVDEEPASIPDDEVASDAMAEFHPSAGHRQYSYDADAEEALAATLDDVLVYWPAQQASSQQHTDAVRSAFALARSGALYAAEQQFVNVLEQIATARDTSACTAANITALSAGFAALDEAKDFVAAATSCTAAEVNLFAVAAAHQTPILAGVSPDQVLPYEVIALYHRYAERKLASAVGDDPAASMALFGLGKVHAHRAQRDGDDDSAVRLSVSMYQAATMVRHDNPLAANELGVVLARSGRYQQAHLHLSRAVETAPTASHYHNLAIVERHLGRDSEATRLAALAQQLASRELASGYVARRRGVTWVRPEDFNRTSEGPQAASSPQVAVQAAPAGEEPSTTARRPVASDEAESPRQAAAAPAVRELQPRKGPSGRIRRPGTPPSLHRY